MLKYRCLVLDHDDSVVETEKSIGYPYFRDFIERIRPGHTLSYAQYVSDCNNMVFADMCRAKWQMTDAELHEEYTGWKAYSRVNIPTVCPGMDRVIRRQKELGGLVCVASLSTKEIIDRDFMAHFGFLPDAVYDYDLPAHLRKPAPYAMQDLMDRFDLRPEEMLMVDDMSLGYHMAKIAGVPSAFAAWSKKEFPQLCREMRQLCDFSFETAEELEKFLFGDK